MTSPSHSARLRDAAQEASLARDYMIKDSRTDTCGHQFREGHHSRHEAIQAYARIEGALRRWRSP